VLYGKLLEASVWKIGLASTVESSYPDRKTKSQVCPSCRKASKAELPIGSAARMTQLVAPSEHSGVIFAWVANSRARASRSENRVFAAATFRTDPSTAYLVPERYTPIVGYRRASEQYERS
jgi:hypothetical protein